MLFLLLFDSRFFKIQNFPRCIFFQQGANYGPTGPLGNLTNENLATFGGHPTKVT